MLTTLQEQINFVNFLLMAKAPVCFKCEYKNWRLESSTRKLIARELWYGSTDWHPTPCLLLKAHDLERDVERDFALAGFNMATLEVLD